MIYFFLELHVGQTVIYLRAEDATKNNMHSPYTVKMYTMTAYMLISRKYYVHIGCGATTRPHVKLALLEAHNDVP